VAKLERFNEIIARFKSVADFVVVYIQEAHPSNGWAFRNNIKIARHTKLQERIEAAKQLEDIGISCDIVVDDMTDECNIAYGGFYERLYIVLNDVIVYAGERGPTGYKIEEIYQWLQQYKS